MKLALAFLVGSAFWGVFFRGAGDGDSEVDSAQAYWTYDRLEPDTLAAAWLIQRHAPEGSILSFVDRGQSGEGLPFDIPLAKLSRTYSASSASVVATHFGVTDPATMELLQLIDEIELSGWSDEPSPKAHDLEIRLRTIINSAESPESALQSAGALFREALAVQEPNTNYEIHEN